MNFDFHDHVVTMEVGNVIAFPILCQCLTSLHCTLALTYIIINMKYYRKNHSTIFPLYYDVETTSWGYGVE